MTDDRSEIDRRRIEALENVVRALVRDVEQLRDEVGKARGRPVGASSLGVRVEYPKAAEAAVPEAAPAATEAQAPLPPAAPRPLAAEPPRRAPSGPSLEQAIGRYGTVAVAALAILLGLGAFLQWAIARGLLGPEMRVALGAVAAIVLAGLGFRLRARGSRRFGNALLAIALAVTHLVAWAAGPSLELVPPMAALAVAAAASLALAVLALREEEEYLFSLGLGGALIAPFTLAAQEGTVTQLLVYGGLVMVAAMLVVQDVTWRVTRWLVTSFAAVYVMGALDGIKAAADATERYRPASFLLLLALAALFVAGSAVRRLFARAMLALLVLTIFAVSVRDADWRTVAYAALGTLATLALVRRTPDEERAESGGLMEQLVLPVGFMLSAVLTDGRFDEPAGAAIAGAWAALYGGIGLWGPVGGRGRAVAVAFVAAQFAAMAGLDERAIAAGVASAALAVGAVLAARGLPGRSMLVPIGLSLLLATGYTVDQFTSRTAYAYTPFVRWDSLLALAAVAAWWVLARQGPALLFAPRTLEKADDHPEVGIVRALGAVAAFVWVRAELAEAFSRDLATFLLITYYAAAGVLLIGVGRARAIASARHVGLGLALLAALKAVAEAADLQQVGLRVGSYLVVGVFLLGVGYWYRGGAEARAE